MQHGNRIKFVPNSIMCWTKVSDFRVSSHYWSILKRNYRSWYSGQSRKIQEVRNSQGLRMVYSLSQVLRQDQSIYLPGYIYHWPCSRKGTPFDQTYSCVCTYLATFEISCIFRSSVGFGEYFNMLFLWHTFPSQIIIQLNHLDISASGGLSNYALTLMVIYYLQRTHYLPILQEVFHQLRCLCKIVCTFVVNILHSSELLLKLDECCILSKYQESQYI